MSISFASCPSSKPCSTCHWALAPVFHPVVVNLATVIASSARSSTAVVASVFCSVTSGLRQSISNSTAAQTNFPAWMYSWQFIRPTSSATRADPADGLPSG